MKALKGNCKVPFLIGGYFCSPRRNGGLVTSGATAYDVALPLFFFFFFFNGRLYLYIHIYICIYLPIYLPMCGRFARWTRRVYTTVENIARKRFNSFYFSLVLSGRGVEHIWRCSLLLQRESKGVRKRERNRETKGSMTRVLNVWLGINYIIVHYTLTQDETYTYINLYMFVHHIPYILIYFEAREK